MVKVHINNTKHITIANIYISPRNTTFTHYKTADTDIQHCIQYTTNIPHSVLTGDVNAHSTLWHSYTDDHRGQLIADVISNSNHTTLNTNTPTRVPNTTRQQTSSPDITTVSNKLYNRTSWTTQHALSSDHLPIITTINIQLDYRLQQNRNIRHLKHIGPLGHAFLTSMFKTALNKNIIPHTWKLANIVPIPKPNKDTNKGTAYRPISLLSVIAKTLEKSLLPYITANIPNTPMQHGYKTQHSTVTALHTLNNTVEKGFNQIAPPARTNCSTRYEKSFRHNKHTHTNQKAAIDKHSRHNH